MNDNDVDEVEAVVRQRNQLLADNILLREKIDAAKELLGPLQRQVNPSVLTIRLAIDILRY